MGVDVRDRAAELLRPRRDERGGEVLAALGVRLDRLGERAAVAVLHHDRERLLVQEAAKVGDDVGVREALEDAHLRLDLLELARPEPLRRHLLRHHHVAAVRRAQ